MLARAQAGDRIGVVRAAGEMEAAEPLHGQDPPAPELLGGGLDRVPGARSRLCSPPSASISRTLGPHAGHAFGWA